MIYPLLLNLLAVFALGYAHAEMIKGLFYYETTDRYIYIYMSRDSKITERHI